MNLLQSQYPEDNYNKTDMIHLSSPSEINSVYNSYLTDESRFISGWAEEIFFPKTEAQLCQILREMSNQNRPVTISGARTGIVAGAVPLGGVLINMERMNRVLDILFEEGKGWSLLVEPGLRLSDLYDYVELKALPLPKEKMQPFLNDPNTYFYPPDPTEATALIGSTVATNASGARSFFYGMTRAFVESLRVALTNGEILDIERGKCFPSSDGKFHIMDAAGKKLSFAPPDYSTPLIKSSCGLYSRPGMDLIDLFIGSEGILGVITAVKLRLEKKPVTLLSGLSFFPEEKLALSFVMTARSQLKPLALEYFDAHSLDLVRSHDQGAMRLYPPQKSKAALFWEISCHEDELEEVYEEWELAISDYGSSMEDTWSGVEKKDWLKLKEFRHSVPEIINAVIRNRKIKTPDIHKVSTDFAVPDHQMMTIIEEYTLTLEDSGLEYCIFGHIGDNHLHINLLPEDNKKMQRARNIVIYLAKKVVSLGGVVAAEHGIGKLKHNLLEIQYGEKGLREMARIKKAIDPQLILGRGNIIPEKYLNV